jgi:hypothetical protein
MLNPELHNSEVKKPYLHTAHAVKTREATILPWAQQRRLEAALAAWLHNVTDFNRFGSEQYPSFPLDSIHVKLDAFVRTFNGICDKLKLTPRQSVVALNKFLYRAVIDEETAGSFRTNEARHAEYSDLYAKTVEWISQYDKQSSFPHQPESTVSQFFTDINAARNANDTIQSRVGALTPEGNHIRGFNPTPGRNPASETPGVLVRYQSVDGSEYSLCVAGTHHRPDGSKVSASPAGMAIHVAVELAKGGSASSILEALEAANVQFTDAEGKPILYRILSAAASPSGDSSMEDAGFSIGG